LSHQRAWLRARQHFGHPRQNLTPRFFEKLAALHPFEGEGMRRQPELRASYERGSLISVFCERGHENGFHRDYGEWRLCQSSFLCYFFLQTPVQAPFRHRYRFKSTGLAPVS